MYALAQSQQGNPPGDSASQYGMAMSGGDPAYFDKPLAVPTSDAQASQLLSQAQASWPISKVPDNQKSMLLQNMLTAYRQQSKSPLAGKLLAAVQAKRAQVGHA